MTEATVQISRQDAQHVIYMFNPRSPGGLEPGSFTSFLIQAIMKADVGHKVKLSNEYPGLVEAVRMVQNDRDGLETLTNIAAFTSAPGTWQNGGLTFRVCPECKGKNSRDHDDLGNVSSWCGACGGEGRILVK